MKKNRINNIAGLTLIEILIGVVISTMMMAAMYTTYNVVNNSYSQVSDKAKISRAGRDIIGMIMRDIRMAGFHYDFGTNALGISSESYLQYNGYDSTVEESHDPIIVLARTLGYESGGENGYMGIDQHNDADPCCDRIHIVYGDFNQNHLDQPYKKYKITYYALPRKDGKEKYYGIYKTKKSWKQKVGETGGDWDPDCSECYQGELIRDHLYDMEFIVFDGEGRRLYNTSTNTYPTPENASRKDLYNIRAIDVRLTFRSKKEFFRKDAPAGKPRFVKGLGDRSRLFTDKYLRDSIVVTVHTRNLGTR
tara:strand:- start:93 stop:1013 length:921 start_codon:yes stop_codon:yes gene_type:complete